MNLFTKQIHRENKLKVIRGEGWWEELEVWDWHLHTSITSVFKIHNQQGHIV